MKSTALGRAFLLTVTLLLLVTAVVKVVALWPMDRGQGGAPHSGLLSIPAPYLPGWTNGDMMWVAVGFELAVVVGLTWLRTDTTRLLLVALVGGIFAAYHIGLGVIGYRHPCGCLGGPLDWLHLSRSAYDALTMAIIVYLLAGSYGLLVRDGLQSLRRLPNPAGTALRPPEPTR